MINLLYNATREPSNSRPRNSESSTHDCFGRHESAAQWFLIVNIELRQKISTCVDAIVIRPGAPLFPKLFDAHLFDFYVYACARASICDRPRTIFRTILRHAFFSPLRNPLDGVSQ